MGLIRYNYIYILKRYTFVFRFLFTYLYFPRKLHKLVTKLDNATQQPSPTKDALLKKEASSIKTSRSYAVCMHSSQESI